MATAQPTAGHSGEGPALPTPGLVGRALRLALGLGTLALLRALITGWWRAELWAGRLPVDFGFLVLVGLALGLTGYVVNIAFGLSWGRRTLVGVLLGAALAATAGGALERGFPNVLFGVYLWVWFTSFCALLGPAHLLAAVLATPGCEMRSYAHLMARLRGGDVHEVSCPGGIDHFDSLRRRRRAGSAG